MKQLLSLLLAASLALAMTSCGGNDDAASDSAPSLVAPESSKPDSSLENPETSSEPESPSSEAESSSESFSHKESSTSSSPASKPAQNASSTSSKPSASSSKPAESSKPESQSSSSKPQEPPIPKPASSSSSSDSKPSSSVDASAVYAAMDSAIAARHEGVDAAIMNLPMEVDDSTLSDMFGVSLSDVVSYKGVFAGSMTNCDIMLVVEAKDGKADTVKKALEDVQSAQKKQFEHYGVMGNTERLDASKVVSNGNFVALLIVGIKGNSEENYDCAGDVSAAYSAFTNVLKK